MTALGKPLVVFRDWSECSGKDEHEAFIVTDGYQCYAEVVGPDGDVEVEAVRVSNGEVMLSCPVEMEGDPCPGSVTFRLTDVCWVANPFYLDKFARLAGTTTIERDA